MSSSVISTIIISAVVLYAGVRWFEWSQTFHPSRRFDPDPAPNLPEREDITFITEDNRKLHGWWIPHDNARGTVIYCHGNAGNISTRWDVYLGFHRLGLNVFAFDYRGYGKSRAIPTENGIYHDVRAAYEVVRARYDDIENPPVLIYGASLGGAPAVRLASEKPVRGLVLEGAFTSSQDIAELWYPNLPVKHVLHYKLDSASLITNVTMPILIAHSTIDRVIPFELGKKLYDVAPEPKTFVRLNGDHGEAGWQDTPSYFTELETFVEGIFPGE